MSRLITLLLTISLLLLAISSTSAITTSSPPKNIVTHGDFFRLNREIFINTDKLPKDISIELENLLNTYGATISQSFFKKFFIPKIIFKQNPHLKDIQGDSKVKISVRNKKVLIEYSSPKAALRGVELLNDIFTNRNGIYVIDGVDISDWFTKKPSSEVSKHEGFDLTDAEITKSFIISNINRTAKGASLFLYATTPQRWAIESQILAESNRQWHKIMAIPHYSIEDVREIISAGEKRGVNVILGVNLAEENEIIKQATGHSIYSVEGMRFARAIIQEYKTKLGLKSIAVGYIPAGINEFYLEFMDRMKELLEIEIIFE